MIVCMSRRICVELYKEIVRLNQEQGAPKVSGQSISHPKGPLSDCYRLRCVA
jgi:hypothetical protein